MNPGLEKVSRGIALAGAGCLWVVGLLAARPSAPDMLPVPTPAALAAEPTRLHLTTGCANARRELRFEMISSDPQGDLVMVPRARVCLAVYRLGAD